MILNACPKFQYVRSTNNDPEIPEYRYPNCGVIYKKLKLPIF